MKSLVEFFEYEGSILNICLNVCSNQLWNKILFYLTVYVEDIRWTDISVCSEYVVDITNNRKMLISRVIF